MGTAIESALRFFSPIIRSRRPSSRTALEERGFELLWVAEHSHIPVPRRTPAPGGGELPKRYYDVMDPFVTLTAAAAVTRRLSWAPGCAW